MFKLFCTLVISQAICLVSHAQTNLPCAFEELFSLKPGMSKPTVMDSLDSRYKATLLRTESEKMKPYSNSGEDSIFLETLSYKTEAVRCFHGTNSIIKVDFADDKLYKVYLATEFPVVAYADLMSNFNQLRNNIKKTWKYENSIKISSSTVEGFGYVYTKTQKKTNKPESCTLQYVRIKGNTPSADKYILEVIWANLQNTRMEGSIY